MPHGKCQFQARWLEDDAKDGSGHKLLHYFVPDKEDNYRAYCTICSKSVSISNQGKAALIQHARGTIHKEKVRIKMGLSEQGQLPMMPREVLNQPTKSEIMQEVQADEESRRDFGISEIMLVLRELSLSSLLLGDYLVILRSDFDLFISGEPYLASMCLFNLKTGKYFTVILI